MPDIYPTGKIQLYRGILLDNTYQHCLWFNNTNAKETFWSTTPHLKHTLSARQYQRVTSGVCEVALRIEQLYDINYMRFQNTDFSSLWFYAFVKNVEYVNDANSRIYYEIDVMQTHQLRYGIRASFVERMHSTTDVAGDNLVEEPIKFAPPVAFAREERFWDQFVAVITISDFLTIDGVRTAVISRYGNLLQGGVYKGVSVNGCGMDVFDLTIANGLTQFQQALSVIDQSQAAIINIFLFPKALFGGSGVNLNTGQQDIYFNPYNTAVTKPTTLDGYTPRNNKLMSYPYCYLCVDNGQVTNDYRWEYFTKVDGWDRYSFVIKGVPIPTPNVFIAPLNYKNKFRANEGDYLYEERLDLATLPQIAYPTDSYAAWLAQTESSRQNKILTGAAAGVGTGLAAGAKLGSAIGAAGGPVGAVAGGAIGAALGGVLGAVGAKVANDMAITEAADMKNKVSGAGSEASGLADGKWGVIFKKMTINRFDAATIDSFFDMFGYAQNKIMVPTIGYRPHWTYLKTNGINLNIPTGYGMPTEHITKIKSVYDAGVTFWNNHDEIGNYSLDNRLT